MRKTLLAGAVSAVVLAFTATLVAATVTSNGVTLEYPTYPARGPGLQHCEPWNDDSADDVRLTGIPEGANVTFQFIFTSGLAGDPLAYPAPLTFINVTGGVLEVDIPYPQDTLTWPYQFEGTRGIVVALVVSVSVDGTRFKLSANKWKVICNPDEPDEEFFEGCTVGYWKQDQHFDSWTTYVPGDFFDAVFGVDSALDPAGPDSVLANPTLLDALEIGGGGENGMARQAVAALLNAASADVTFPMSVADVIAAVQNAYATGHFDAAHFLFEGYNEAVTTLPDGTTYHCGLN